MPNIGPLELVIVLVIALIIFGPKRVPELGRSLGRGIREFKSSVTGDRESDEKRHELREPSPDEGEEPVEGEVVGERRG